MSHRTQPHRNEEAPGAATPGASDTQNQHITEGSCTMNNSTYLIAIESAEIGGQAIETVNARELHSFLEIGRDFTTWIKSRIEQYGFVENLDYTSREAAPRIGGAGNRGARTEYHLSLDMAKELSMVERNEKGKQARQYFIECERKAKQAPSDPMQALSDPATMRELLLGYSEKVLALESAVKEQAPKVAAYDRISASDETLTITQAAKVLGVKRDHLTKYMAAKGWIYRQNKSWVAYKAQETAGRLVYKEAKYTDDNTGMEVHRPYCHLTQKGLAKLAVLLQEGSL